MTGRTSIDHPGWSRHLPGPRERCVEIRRLDQIEAAELLLGLGERPVDGDGLLVSAELTVVAVALGCRPSPATNAPASRNSDV